MKKIISIIFIFIFLNISSIYAYNIDEGAVTVNNVINKLDGSDYTFKINEGSSAKSSYYILYKGNMIGYIYATDNGITLGDGWDSNGELGIFFNQTDLTVKQIIDRFYIDKSPLGDSVLDSNSYLCSGETKDFFRCLLNYSNQNKNSNGKIYLFEGDISKNININFNDNFILFKSIDSKGIELSCKIEKNKKDKLISMLGRWSNGSFSNKDFDYTNCTKLNNSKNLNNSNFDIGDLNNLDLGSNLNNSYKDKSIVDSNNLSNNVNGLNLNTNNSTNSGTINLNKLDNLTNTMDLNIKNNNIFNINLIDKKSNTVNVNTKITYQDGLDIINDTNKKIDIINNNMKNNSLRDKMLKYRAMWNSIKIKLDKNIEGKEGLRIKYLYKVIEDKYKEIFKKYVLSQRNNNINKKIIIDETKIMKKPLDKLNIDNNIIVKSNLSDQLLLNFKNLFYLLGQKYNKQGNFSVLAKKNMESLFDKVDKKNEYNSINDFLLSSPDILNNNSNIDLLQKLMIIMCKQ